METRYHISTTEICLIYLDDVDAGLSPRVVFLFLPFIVEM